MKETLISYMPNMILAKLAGRKTQTRRIIQRLPKNTTSIKEVGKGMWMLDWEGANNGYMYEEIKCSYGKVGDILLTREGYKINGSCDTMNTVAGQYLADGKWFETNLLPKEFAKWRARKHPYRATPGRFMYKSLIRLRDEITDIRVQKIQDISESDAKAECVNPGFGYKGAESDVSPSYINGFANLWDSINAKRGYSWENNDWVFAITTKPLAGRM